MARSNPANKAVREHFNEKMPARIKKLVAAADWDLHNGPGGGGGGYTKALDEISAWSDDNVDEVWYDSQSGYVEESEPQGFEDGGEYFEPSWEDYVHFKRSDVMRAVFGALVTEGGLN